MTALERAARAAQDEIERQVAETGYLGWGAGQEENRPPLGETYVDGDLDVSALVRAVLMAVREPTNPVQIAGHRASRGAVLAREALAFTAMIDAILQEKPE